MKTTLELPDDLMRAIKLRAVHEDRKLKDLIADLLRRGLADADVKTTGRRVQVPLIRCAHPASPETEMTPERVAQVLLAEEADAASRR